MKRLWSSITRLSPVKSAWLLLAILGCAYNSFASVTGKVADTSISAEIRVQLGDFKNARVLHFPHSVFRFYRQHNFQPVWVKPGDDPKHTWEGVLLINCVLQFGLCHADYHPKEIDYTRLHIILEHPERVNNNEKARYDLMITDALITFINHLHYGKLNPYFTSAKIDAGIDTGFIAGKVLSQALRKPHFMSSIADVQLKTKAFIQLEEKMRELTQFQQDCDGLPDSAVRKMAINLERMRWVAASDTNWIQLNIPSFKLTVHEMDKTDEFKAIVGAPSTPTPQLNSILTDFTTAPKLKISHSQNEPSGTNPRGVIYFWFKNTHGLSIAGLPGKYDFEENERDLSKGNIKIENGQRLAELLLKIDGNSTKIQALREAIDDYAISNFILRKPIQLKITYITCEVQNGVILTYNDVYSLDKKLGAALYNISEYLVSE